MIEECGVVVDICAEQKTDMKEEYPRNDVTPKQPVCIKYKEIPKAASEAKWKSDGSVVCVQEIVNLFLSATILWVLSFYMRCVGFYTANYSQDVAYWSVILD